MPNQAKLPSTSAAPARRGEQLEQHSQAGPLSAPAVEAGLAGTHAPPPPYRPTDLLALQRSLGNRAVGRLLGRGGASRGSAPVIQRIVPLGMQAGTKVKIKRTTSPQLHGMIGEIVGPGEAAYEYVVKVGLEEYTVSIDQLVPEQEDLAPVQINADLEAFQGLSAAEIAAQVKEQAAQAFEIPQEAMVLGGSFAAFLHALEAQKEARTPRDIDIILPANIFGQKFQGPNVERTNHQIFGIPIEFHKAGAHGKPNEHEAQAGILHLNTLLAKNLIKLLDQTHVFRTVVTLPNDLTEEDTAQSLAEKMEANTAQVLTALQDGDNYRRDSEIWVKTLKDIKQLVASGATLDQYKLEEDPWDD